jgi:hypothetical protein
LFFEGPYRFFFWAYDCAERKHIHVERDEVIAKFWVDPDFSLEDGGGFSRKDLRDIQRVIERRKEEVENGWGRFCK